MSGKGSKQRPREIPIEQFDDNWDRIFKRQPQQGPKLKDQQ